MITAQEARTRWGYVTRDDSARLDDEAAELAAMVADGWHQIDAARAPVRHQGGVMARPEIPLLCPECKVCGPCESGVHTCCRVRVPAGDMYHLCRCDAASCAARREEEL